MSKRSSHLTGEFNSLEIQVTGIRIHDLCDARAVLYQLSYEATQLKAEVEPGTTRDKFNQWPGSMSWTGDLRISRHAP